MIRGDFKNYTLQLRRRIAQSEDLLAHRFIGDLVCGAGDYLAFGGDAYGIVSDHVLTPVFALDSTRCCVKFSLQKEKAQLDGARQAALAAGGR